MARPAGTKYISVEEMEEYFEAYKTDTKDNPFLEHDFVGKDGNSVERKKQRCLTMEGFNCYLFGKNIIVTVQDYFNNKDGKYDDYSLVCSRIKMEIRRDQIEGGMAGIYNPSITQRLNGLVEKTAHQINVEQPLLPDVPKDDGVK